MKHLKIFKEFKVNETLTNKRPINIEETPKPKNPTYELSKNLFKMNEDDAIKAIDSFISEYDINGENSAIARSLGLEIGRGYNNIKVINYLFDKGIDISTKNYMGLMWAFLDIKNDIDIKVLDVLLSHIDNVDILEKVIDKINNKDYIDLINKRIKEL